MPFKAKCCCPTTKWQHSSRFTLCSNRLLTLFEKIHPGGKVPSKQICYVCKDRVDKDPEFTTHPEYIRPKLKGPRKKQQETSTNNLSDHEFYILKIPVPEGSKEVEGISSNDTSGVENATANSTARNSQVEAQGLNGVIESTTGNSTVARSPVQPLGHTEGKGSYTLTEESTEERSEVEPHSSMDDSRAHISDKRQEQTNKHQDDRVETSAMNSSDVQLNNSGNQQSGKKSSARMIDPKSGGEIVISQDLIICGLCGTGFLDILKFLEHKSYHKTVSSSHRCELCKLSFTRHTSLVDHYRRKHELENCIPDVKLSDRFKHKDGIVESKTSDSVTKKKVKQASVACQVTSKMLRLQARRNARLSGLALETNKNKNAAENTEEKTKKSRNLDFYFILSIEMIKKNNFDYANLFFNCLHCYFKTTYKSSFAKHMNTEHEELIDIHDSITQTKGSLMTMSEYSIKYEDRPVDGSTGPRVEKQDMQIGEYPCSYCGKIFDRLRNLRSHLETHRDNRSFKCDECLKSFKSNAYLYAHKKRFHKGMTYTCQYESCNFTCKLYSNYRKHKMKHIPSKNKVTCDICWQSYLSVSQLKKHRTVHDSKRAFQCDVVECKWRFKSDASMKAHLKWYHKEDENLADINMRSSNAMQGQNNTMQIQSWQQNSNVPTLEPNTTQITFQAEDVSNFHRQVNNSLQEITNNQAQPNVSCALPNSQVGDNILNTASQQHQGPDNQTLSLNNQPLNISNQPLNISNQPLNISNLNLLLSPCQPGDGYLNSDPGIELIGQTDTGMNVYVNFSNVGLEQETEQTLLQNNQIPVNPSNEFSTSSLLNFDNQSSVLLQQLASSGNTNQMEPLQSQNQDETTQVYDMLWDAAVPEDS